MAADGPFSGGLRCISSMAAAQDLVPAACELVSYRWLLAPHGRCNRCYL